MDAAKEKSINQPQYAGPTTGLLSYFPSSVVPFAQLMRLDKPGGFYAFYFPYLLGLIYVACFTVHNTAAIPPSLLLHRASIFLLGSIFLRGAACTWNDNIDQDFDRKFERCRFRPIARGAISTTQGHIFTIVQTIAGSTLFSQLPIECVYDAIPIALLFGLYPFGKRFTDYPQLILGFPFAGAIFMAAHSIGLEPTGEDILPSATCLLTANVLWTMIYDTIYAHQDKNDDEKAGVKSMAVRFRDNTKPLASVLAVAVIGLLCITGMIMRLSQMYYVLTCGGTALSLGAMIFLVDLNTPASCMWWFTWGFWMVGGSMSSGFLGEYVVALM